MRKEMFGGAVLLITVSGMAFPAVAQEVSAGDEVEAKSSSDSRINAGLEIVGGYNDNIYATGNNELDDFYLLARPFVRADLSADGTSVALRGEGELGRYDQYSSEDYNDWLLAMDGRTRIASSLSLITGAQWQWEHETRASPEAVSGIEPTQYQRGYGYLGLIGSSGNFTGRLAGTAARYDFDDVATVGGTINNDDRDRLQSEIGLRGGYRLKRGTELFLQGAYDRRDYEASLDDWGYRRDSEGYALAAGVRGKLGSEFEGEFFVGWLEQDYRDVRLRDIGTFDVGGVLDWSGKGGMGATIRLDRSIDETTLPGASGYITTTGRISVRNDIGSRLSAGVGLSGSHYDYVGATRSEFVVGGDVWARYWVDRHFYVDATFMHGERSSNAAGYDYNQNRFQISLGSRLRPGFSADAQPLRFGVEIPAGPYAGVMFGHGTLVTALDGPRGQGSNTADFGDHGGAGVAVFGYGFLVDTLYLGFEVEGVGAGPDWAHTHSADRVYSVERENAVGVSARVGFTTPRSDLIYGRVGLSSAEMQADYTQEDVSLYSEDERRMGLGFGLGLEVPAGARGFLRAEYVITSYDDIDVPSSETTVDNMAANESQFRIGGGIRFGERASKGDELPPIQFGGPYIGLQIGHGALVSSNQGTRNDDSTIDVTRASQGGLLGLFAGYGALMERAYLGLEAEGDVSAVNWNIEREPTGRTYSAEHDYSFGGSARAGVLIGNSALVYGRVGVVRTRFELPYETTSTAVRSTDTRTGVRYGGGIEIGLGGRARMRADYSITDYAAYDVEYGRSVDRFDHSEAQFRLGITWRA